MEGGWAGAERWGRGIGDEDGELGLEVYIYDGSRTFQLLTRNCCIFFVILVGQDLQVYM